MSQSVPVHPCFVKSEQIVLGEFRGTKKASSAAVQCNWGLVWQTTKPQKGLHQGHCYHPPQGGVRKGLPSGWWQLHGSICKSFRVYICFKLILLWNRMPLWFSKLVIIHNRWNKHSVNGNHTEWFRIFFSAYFGELSDLLSSRILTVIICFSRRQTSWPCPSHREVPSK